MSTRRKRRSEAPLAALLLLPSFAILGTFVVYPLVRTIWLGHLRCSPTGDDCRSNGWDQYIDVFRSREFQHALGVTAKFALLTVPIGMFLGVALAVLADRYVKGVGFFRTVFSSTVATSVAVASLMWFFLLQPDIGVLSHIGWLNDLFPVLSNPGLLKDPGTALSATAVSFIWANLGFTFIVVTAGLQGVPKELHESAWVDGASGWQRFTNVTVPMLSPTLLFVGVVLTTRAFQAFGEFDLLTEGGPTPQDSTTTLTYLVYGRQSIIQNNDGLQAAAAVLLFLVLLVLSILQFQGLERRVHYGA